MTPLCADLEHSVQGIIRLLEGDSDRVNSILILLDIVFPKSPRSMLSFVDKRLSNQVQERKKSDKTKILFNNICFFYNTTVSLTTV